MLDVNNFRYEYEKFIDGNWKEFKQHLPKIIKYSGLAYNTLNKATKNHETAMLILAIEESEKLKEVVYDKYKKIDILIEDMQEVNLYPPPNIETEVLLLYDDVFL